MNKYIKIENVHRFYSLCFTVGMVLAQFLPDILLGIQAKELIFISYLFNLVRVERKSKAGFLWNDYWVLGHLHD